MNKKGIITDLPLLVMKLVFVVLVFILGGLSASTDTQPFAFLHQGYANTVLFMREALQNRPMLVAQKRYRESGLVTHTADAYQGLTVVQGLLPGGPQLRLIDMSGNELHRWNIDFWKIWPAPSHLPEEAVPKTPFNYHTQGMVVNPDGSVIVNIAEKGTVKLNRCSEVVWTLDRPTHHSITAGLDGGYWIPAHRAVEDIPEELLFSQMTKKRLRSLYPYASHGYENIILHIDEKGAVIREFSVLQALYDAGFEHSLYDALLIRPTDPTHVNDIEVVTKALAQKIEGAEVGDLLISLRQMHMLIILDQNSGAIKWHYSGPWIRQHDPDITPQGEIVVFNNGTEEFSFKRLHGSSLVKLDPATQLTDTIYPKHRQHAFYTDIMGEHQALPNGNRLVVESRAGRLFEINHSDNIVWDYRIAYDNEYASLVEAAARYPLDYFSVEEWSCP